MRDGKRKTQMKAIPGILIGLLICLLLAAMRVAAEPPQEAPPPQNPPATQGTNPAQTPGRGGERRPAVFGKLTAVHDQSIEITRQDGSVVTVKISASTQFRKERESAKLSDFKVGDTVFVRGEENADRSWSAEMIGERPNGGFGGGAGARGGRGAGQGGPGGGGPGGGQPAGVLGQDYVFGEVKAIDAPKLTIIRPDNVTQTIELNEETSLRKGRDSITMADIQAGDHIMVRGGMVNNAFQPKSVVVISPEQWKRMQEMGSGGANGQAAKPPQDTSKPQNPPEPPH
jgi:preprotein translocase subunit YajC